MCWKQEQEQEQEQEQQEQQEQQEEQEQQEQGKKEQGKQEYFERPTAQFRDYEVVLNFVRDLLVSCQFSW